MNTSTRRFDTEIRWSDTFPLTHDQLVRLLRVFGDLLPDPLSQRIELDEYATKLLDKADIAYALHEDDIVALLAMYANDGDSGAAFISIVSVLPEYQGRGIGKMLVSQAVALARQRGMRRIWLKVKHNNVVAQHVYESLGFRRSSYRPPKLEMKLDLTANHPEQAAQQ